MSDLDIKKAQMIAQHLRKRGIHNKKILSAMGNVPRELFVENGDIDCAYDDRPLPIQEGQTISQPYMVALMAQALHLKETDRVLDVGTGSGYAAAVLGQLVEAVYTIERHRSLFENAQKRFEQMQYKNIHCLCADGSQGWEEFAPFDAISVAASAMQIPELLKQQLAVGGRLVIPIQQAGWHQQLLLIQRTTEEIYKTEDLGSVRFVPLIS